MEMKISGNQGQRNIPPAGSRQTLSSGPTFSPKQLTERYSSCLTAKHLQVSPPEKSTQNSNPPDPPGNRAAFRLLNVHYKRGHIQFTSVKSAPPFPPLAEEALQISHQVPLKSRSITPL